MEADIEGIQLTIGGLLFICGLAFAVAGAVWTVAKIRNTDKENIEKGYSNAVNRVDEKHIKNVTTLHERIDHLTEKDAEFHELKGALKTQEKLIFKILDKSLK